MFATTYPWSLQVWAFFLVCLVFSVFFSFLFFLLIQSVCCPFQLFPIHTKAKKKKKKPKQTGNQVLFSDPAENWGHRTHYCPQNWRDRQSHDLGARAQGRDPQGPSSRAGNLSYTDKVLWAGGSVLADPTLLWVSSQEAINQVITVKIREESPCAPSKGKRKGTNLKRDGVLCSS